MDFKCIIPQFKENGDSPEIHKDYNFVLSPTFEFPLKPSSADISILKHPKDLKLSQDDILFLEALQVSCTGVGLEELSTEFFVLGSELVNRLDQSQKAAPLHYASINGHTAVVKHLLDSGADVDIWDGARKVTPLICAAAKGHLETVDLLLQLGCDVNACLNRQHSSGSALMWAVRGNHPEVVQSLLSSNSCQNSTVLYSETPIHASIRVGNTSILEMLIGHKEASKVNFQMGSRRDTPLHLAARGKCPNSVETCKLLLQKGNVSVNAVNASGKTALHLAAAAGEPEVVQLLLSHWASAEVQDTDGRTPLFHMIYDATKWLKSLEVLIFRGKCNVNHQDKCGYTALHLAAHRGAKVAAELLLMAGADFSLKSSGGVPALSMLHRKIPTISSIIHRVFDQAVTVSQTENRNDLLCMASSAAEVSRQDCVEVEVNFQCMLPSAPSTKIEVLRVPERRERKPTRFSRVTTKLSHQDTNGDDCKGLLRKETAKIKCLVDEGLTDLLLHPVIHSFLEMKWHKARPIFFPILLFKIAFVLLFSVYLRMPGLMEEKVEWTDSTNSESGPNVPATKAIANVPVSVWVKAMHINLVTMAALKGIMELTHFLRSPKTKWSTLEHWISLMVLLIVIINMRSDSWGRRSNNPINRSIAALGILLAWIDVWYSMSRYPKLGQSIRIFFQVFKNFLSFMLPHFCLLAGFALSLTQLMPGNGEFDTFLLSTAKIVRIMAGDITISSNGSAIISSDATSKEIVSHFLLVYIYTAFVLMVAIVLMNLLTGLAVNDLQGIYADASINKLVKQTLLLNTLESNFRGRFIQLFLPKTFEINYINLFQAQSQKKTLSFMPYDPRDRKVSWELKHALQIIGNATEVFSPHLYNDTGSESSNNDYSSNDLVRKSTIKKLIQGKGEDHQVLMKKIDELVSDFLAKKSHGNVSRK